MKPDVIIYINKLIFREMSIVLLLEDQMHRQLTTSINKGDNPETLTENLITHGFMCQVSDFVGVLP